MSRWDRKLYKLYDIRTVGSMWLRLDVCGCKLQYAIGVIRRWFRWIWL